MTRTRFPLVMLALSVFACGGDSDTTEPNTSGDNGSMSFTFTGGGGGTYSASGALSPAWSEATAHATMWAAGLKETVDGISTVAAIASVPRSNGVADQAIVSIARQTPGSDAVNSDCDPEVNGCSGMAFIIGMNVSGTSWTQLCSLDTGTITLSTITSTRASGTFSGTGTCLSSSFTGTTFSVTNGSFNVPLMSDVPSGI